MWSCSFWTQPQKVVGYHRETHHFSEGKSAKEFTAPQHTRFILPLFHPTKSIAMLHGRYFSFTGNAPWKSHEPTERDTDFSSTPLQNRGRNFVRSKRWPTYMSSTTSTYFCALTIRKQLPRNGFERSGRGQEPSRGHKFSIFKNVVLHRDFTSATLASFDVILLGRACPKPCSWFAPDGANSNGVSCFT